MRFIALMNDGNQTIAETDEFAPRVHFLINPNDGSLCLIKGLVSPGEDCQLEGYCWLPSRQYPPSFGVIVIAQGSQIGRTGKRKVL